MEAIIFVGIQGSGKSTFFGRRFSDTHVRLNLDMLRTRHREDLLLDACIAAKQKFVIDNTNLTREGRSKYINKARDGGFKILGYYFRSELRTAIERNSLRNGRARIPEKGILGAHKRLQLPSLEEGFDELFYVRTDESDEFVVENWVNEI